MNKQYMDFVPASKSKTAGRTTTRVVKEKVSPRGEFRAMPSQAVRGRSARVGGVVGMRKVQNAKRAAMVVKKPEAVKNGQVSRAVVQKTNLNGGVRKVGVKTGKKETGLGLGADLNRKKKVMAQSPKVNFINQEKIEKRPLSGSVKRGNENLRDKSKAKKVGGMMAEAKAPAMIVSKEKEKKSKTGIIVAILVSVILGVAAGAVAFLLLPK